MNDTLMCVSDRPTKVLDLLAHHLCNSNFLYHTYVVGDEHELIRTLKNKRRTEFVVAYYDTMGSPPSKINAVHAGSHRWHMAKMISVINPRYVTSVRTLYLTFGSPTPDGVGVYFMNDTSDQVVLRYRANATAAESHYLSSAARKSSEDRDIKAMSWC